MSHGVRVVVRDVEFLFGIERKVFPIVFATHHRFNEFSSLPSMQVHFILGWALLARLPPLPFFRPFPISPRSRSKEVGSAPSLSILGRNHVSSIKYGGFSWPPSASVHALVSYWAPCFPLPSLFPILLNRIYINAYFWLCCSFIICCTNLILDYLSLYFFTFYIFVNPSVFLVVYWLYSIFLLLWAKFQKPGTSSRTPSPIHHYTA